MSPKIIPKETIDALVSLAEAHEILELSVTTPDGKFKIRRAPGAPAEYQSAPASRIEREERQAKAHRDNLVKVISPLMGIFYRAPAPGVDPFVSIGERVQVGDTLCIIEAMKVMNEITSEVTGTIEEILGKNGEVVEDGAILFRIKPEKEQ